MTDPQWGIRNPGGVPVGDCFGPDQGAGKSAGDRRRADSRGFRQAPGDDTMIFLEGDSWVRDKVFCGQIVTGKLVFARWMPA